MHEGHDHHHHHHHDHHHDHDHEHSHAHEASDAAMAIALLRYMAEHNRSHTAELSELSEKFDEKTAAMIADAVLSYDVANAKLDAALASAEALAEQTDAAETPESEAAEEEEA